MANKKTKSKAKSISKAKTTKKVTNAKTKTKEVYEEKGSILNNLAPKKEDNGRISFSKAGLIIISVVMVILIGCSLVIGHNIDFKNPFVKTEEDIQIAIENHISDDIVALNKKLSGDAKLEDSATYIQDGQVMDYNYYQYVSYSKDMNWYVAWIMDKETGETIAVWAAGQRPEDIDDYSATVMKEFVTNLYKDKITDENREKALDAMKTQEQTTLTGTDFAYLQEFSTENLSEGYQYACIYEVDFFTYKPSEDQTSATETTENETTSEIENATSEK